VQTRLAFSVKADRDGEPAVAQVQRMSAALGAEADHRAGFPLQADEIGVLIRVNAYGCETATMFVHRVLL
jgi:hypothetical protein